MIKGLGAAIVLVLLGSAIWLWSEKFREGAGTSVDNAARVAAEPPQGHAREAALDSPRVAQEAPARDDVGHVAARFRAATNYLDFLNAVLPAAQAGDREAQFWTFKALEFCQSEYSFYFLTRGRELTLDEGVRRMVTRWPNRPEYARQVHERCHEVFEKARPELRNRIDWLHKAVEAGDPRAQADLAGLYFKPDDDPMAGTVRAVSADEAKRLVGSALRSRDPEVLMRVGDLQYLLFGDDVWEHENTAWHLAACERGADCGPESPRVFFYCIGINTCQPYEGLVELIRRDVAAEFPTIEQRARQISALIDAGEWAELRFGETTEDP